MNGQQLVLKLLNEYEVGSDSQPESDSMQDFAGSGSEPADHLKGCGCGSGEETYWTHDHYGTPLFKVCPRCHDDKMAAWHQHNDEHYAFPEDAELPTEGLDPDGDPLPEVAHER